MANGHMACLNTAAKRVFGNLSRPPAFGSVVCIIVSEEVGKGTIETD